MEKITVLPNEALSDRYKIRRAGKGTTLESCIPHRAIEREARKRGMSMEEFLDTHEAEFLYNDFSGLHIRFIRVK